VGGGRCKATWKRESKLLWREAGPPHHHDDKVVSDQQVWVWTSDAAKSERCEEVHSTYAPAHMSTFMCPLWVNLVEAGSRPPTVGITVGT